MTGTTIKARPTAYRGIEMRSRLEAHWAANLDKNWTRDVWEYEPHCFASEHGQYLPDFGLRRRRPDGTLSDKIRYHEVKPVSALADTAGVQATLAKMEIIWDTDPNASLWLWFVEYEGGVSTIAAGGPSQLWLAGPGAETVVEEMYGNGDVNKMRAELSRRAERWGA